MVYKIGLCDDDSYFLDSLKDALVKYTQIHSLTFEISTYSSGEELLINYQQQYFHLLFLDIEMGGINGLEVAKKLRQAGDAVSIIYTTVHEKYAFSSYQVVADSYLIKPIVEELLFAGLTRVIQRLTLQASYQNRKNTYFSLNSQDGIVQLPYDDILYISKTRNLLTFYTISQKYLAYMNLKDALKKLDTTIFVKINRGQVVNWTKVTRLNRVAAFIGDTELPISRSHTSALYKRYHQEVEQLLRYQED